MLAEKKVREKWSQDPRNTSWSNDTSKFGYRMLQRMGWKEGKGLGIREDGGKEHVRVSRKGDKLSVGGKKGRDDDWIQHQDAFNEILANLNTDQGSPPDRSGKEQAKTLIDSAVGSKRLVYHKFLRSKDMSTVSSTDLDCVLGRKRRRQTSPEQQQVETDTLVTAHGITTVTRHQSVQDYFSKLKPQTPTSGYQKKRCRRNHKPLHIHECDSAADEHTVLDEGHQDPETLATKCSSSGCSEVQELPSKAASKPKKGIKKCY